MLTNKYAFWRRALYRIYDLVPAARRLKSVSLPLKVRKLRRKTAARRQELDAAVAAGGRHPLFTHIEVETINRCNGECGFCPVNRQVDPRPYARMSDAMFTSIVEQLHDLDYRGDFFPYSNNEPLLDARIDDFIALARERLPAARIFLYTNGTLLTPERYCKLEPMLDYITINNYGEDYRLTPNIQAIYEITEADPALRAKTQVVVRYRREIMTSRGGQAPNKLDILPSTLPAGCLLPARQVVVRPDGKISLCCNDALGTMTLGDLTRESLAEAWWGEAWSQLRLRTLAGRTATPLCRHCDTMHF